MKRFLVCAVALLSVFCTVPLHANLLDGQTIRSETMYPYLGNVVSTRDFVVGPGVELTYGFINVDYSDTNMTLTFTGAGTIAGGPGITFNGVHGFDLYGTIPDITSFSINPITNWVGFDASRITFDANNVWANYAGLSYDTNTILSIDIEGPQPAAPVPEPSTMLLLGSGLAGLIGYGRRRMKK